MDEQFYTVNISQFRDKFCLEIPSSLRLPNNEKQRNIVCVLTLLTSITKEFAQFSRLFILVRRTDERQIAALSYNRGSESRKWAIKRDLN